MVSGVGCDDEKQIIPLSEASSKEASANSNPLHYPEQYCFWSQEMLGSDLNESMMSEASLCG